MLKGSDHIPGDLQNISLYRERSGELTVVQTGRMRNVRF